MLQYKFVHGCFMRRLPLHARPVFCSGIEKWHDHPTCKLETATSTYRTNNVGLIRGSVRQRMADNRIEDCCPLKQVFIRWLKAHCVLMLYLQAIVLFNDCMLTVSPLPPFSAVISKLRIFFPVGSTCAGVLLKLNNTVTGKLQCKMTAPFLRARETRGMAKL